MMNSRLEMIAFDADDTLWHSECYYREAQDRFVEILTPYLNGSIPALDVLHQIEIRNLPDFGYGIKGFAISMVEAAVQATAGSIPAPEIQKIVDAARAMTRHEIRLLDYAREAVERLAASYPLLMVTKGDLMDQERKISGSGLGHYFQAVEIVSDKTPAVYQALLQKYNIDSRRFLMVGNSLRSDVLPVIALGGWGVYIPYALTWAHEHVLDAPADPARFFELGDLGGLADLIARIES
jgi:putative hydrolase of the HAD superfamily